MNKIYVGNLPFKIDEADLEKDLKAMLEAYGQVDALDIIKDRETDRPRGFAFATFGSQDAAQKAIEALNGQDFKGRPLKVNLARKKPDTGRRDKW